MSLANDDLPEPIPAAAEGSAKRGAARAPGTLAELAWRKGWATDEQSAGAVSEWLLEQLKNRHQIDFSGYKPGTLLRRLQRRLEVCGVDDLDRYQALIERSTEELDSLARDILVSVTAFFRDRHAFEALRSYVREICQRCRQRGRDARIWVAGCATGEEAYSLAILFDEACRDDPQPPGIQIFATDLDDEALAVARRGHYPASALEGLAPERLNRYFRPTRGGYDVSKRLRDMIVFAHHNLVNDPPFLRLDLVSCRNLLIYFDGDLQARVLKRFHFALHKQGVLFLGRNENVSQAETLFLPLDRRERLFRKQGDPQVVPPADGVSHPVLAPRRREDLQVQQLLDGVVAQQGVTVALCDADGRVLHTAGDVERFFQFPRGRADAGIAEVLDVAFRAELLSMLHRIHREPTPQIGRRRDFDTAAWRLVVCPLLESDDLQLLVMIEPWNSPAEVSVSAGGKPREGAEEELLATREHLQSLVEELATANEEMHALNEKAQAANEGLQAVNEELEAANEELQVTNEELMSLNEELSLKSIQLQRLNEEYTHLYDALEFPVLVFDADSHLRRFNVSASRRFNLRTSALQQHVGRLTFPASLGDLEGHLARSLAHGEPQESLIRGEGRVMQIAVTPGMNDQGEVELLVVSLVDMTEISQAQSALEDSRAQLDTLMANTTLLLAMKDLTGHYRYANPRFLDAFGFTQTDIRGRSDFELFPESFAADNWACDLEALRHPQVVTAEHCLPGESPRVFRTLHQVVRNAEGIPQVIITEAEDITLSKQAERQLRIAAKVFEHAGEAIVVTDHAARIQSVNEAFTRITGYPAEEALGRNIGRLLKSGKADQAFYEAMWDSLNERGFWQGEILNRRKNGELYPEWMTINRIEGSEEEELHFVAVFTDISNLKASQRQAEYLATHDALTGLPNRTLFYDHLDLAMAQARRHDSMVALMFLDLDNFKSINDTLGHDVGDELLVQVAARLRDTLRQLDTLARLGGDEFTLILADATLEGAESIASRLVEELTRPFIVREHSLFVSASIGLAFFPDDGHDASALTKAADTAMYRAKENGRNRVEVFKPELQARMVKQAKLEHAMREALLHDRFRVVFQPKFTCTERPLIAGAEALLRWYDPELGEVSPGEFIPVAEATGLIQEIDRRVVQLATAHLAGWLAAGIAVPPVAINVSARSFQEERFLTHLFERLERFGVPHELIQVEITERTLVERTSTALGNIEKLREAGVLLSIDDFGTGYSSLSYLKRLPLAELKIDKSFVDGLGGRERNDEAIAQAILGMAAALGIRTVAEGVETAEQCAWLIEHGCDFLQGFLLSRPLEVNDFLELLSEADEQR
ncbi:EAL domain-containing protein [Halomonas sp. BM-2019]|uniref:EAL domain-containing protein n=1 Tax=Halomonas sp. BM-2019 TaxID=2811227 RepID=UPI001B3C36E3|nr:MAG: EAL domain-containing protein [Halomonas sp. BM-2019]